MPNTAVIPTKIAVIGTGFVGSTFAYALLLSNLASEIVLIDVNTAKAEGEAMDIAQSAPFAGATQVRAGSIEDCAGAAVTVVTAGANQKPGESRLELGKRNADLFRAIIPQIGAANPDGLLLIATNPVDVLTQLSTSISGLPRQQVLGSGTILDTARLRHFLGDHLGVSSQSVDAYVIGEHGDSSVSVFSAARIGGLSLQEFCDATGKTLTEEDKTEIARKTYTAAGEIISRKGATYYAIAAGLVEIVRAIVRDENAILPVASLSDDFRGLGPVCCGLPTIVNSRGVQRVLPLTLDKSEEEALSNSIQILQNAFQHVG